MESHQIKEFLHSKGDNYQSEETAYSVRKPVQLSIWWGLISRIYKQLKKVNIRRTSNPTNKWTNELNWHCFQMANKYFLKSGSHHGNANQNYVEIPSHPNQDGYHPKNTKYQGMVANNLNPSTWEAGSHVVSVSSSLHSEVQGRQSSIVRTCLKTK